MSGRESVYSPTLDMDQHEEGPEARQKVELRRMMLYHGFQTLVDNNTPLFHLREPKASFKAIVKTDEEESAVNISCDKLVIGPSCWGPDSVPLEIKVSLPDNPGYFSLKPFGVGQVKRAEGIYMPHVVRDMNLGDILRLETILSHLSRPETQINHYHTGDILSY